MLFILTTLLLFIIIIIIILLLLNYKKIVFSLQPITEGDSSGGGMPSVSGDVSLAPGTTVGVSGDVSLAPGSEIAMSIQDGSSIDAFGRLRVSNPVTVFQSSMEVDDQPLIWSGRLSSGGTAVYNINESSVTLTASTALNSEATRQSFKYVRYQPGKSLFTEMSFIMGPPVVNGIQRVGLYDDQNGVFFEQNATSILMAIRSFTSGSVVENTVLQATWNIDTLDGLGPSGLSLDLTTTNILVIDLQWLGVGRVRTGFVLGGKIIYAHAFENDTQTTVYMSRASLPPRYEAVAVSGTTPVSSVTMTQICCVVISEGGFEPRGVIRSAGLGNTPKSISSGVETPVIAIRKKAGYEKAILDILSINLGLEPGNHLIRYIAYFRGSVTGGSWVSAGPDSAVDINITYTGFSGNYIVASGFISKESNFLSDKFESSDLTIGTDVNGVSDIFILTGAVVVGGASKDLFSEITWREIF